MRLFIAIELSGELKNELSRTQETLRRACSDGVSYTRPEQLHLTLKFLDEQPPERLDDIKASLDETVAGRLPFQLALTRPGYFPPHGPARIIWAGLEEQGGVCRLPSMVGVLETLLEPFGVEREDRPFTPHITLARVKDRHSAKTLERALERTSLQPLVQEVGEIILFESMLSSKGATHTPLYSAKLHG